MWKCNECGEESEDQFEACWKCGSIASEIEVQSTPRFSAPLKLTSEAGASHARDKHQSSAVNMSREVTYRYRFVQLPCCRIADSSESDSMYAEHLQSVVDPLTEQGWEYVRIDTFYDLNDKSGDNSSRYRPHSVACFRRPLTRDQ